MFLKSYPKFTGKHLIWIPFFPVNFENIFGRTILISTCIQLVLNDQYKSSHSQIFFNIDVLKNVNFISTLFQLYWKETPTQVFSYEYCDIFKNSLFYRTPLVAASAITTSGTHGKRKLKRFLFFSFFFFNSLSYFFSIVTFSFSYSYFLT